MKIEVRPIESKRWHGKKGKESFTRPKKIQALVDGDSLTYATGLSPEEAEEYGRKLKKDLSNVFDPDSTHEFWDSPMGVIKLENNTMIFDTTKNLDFVHVKIMKASKFVANSMKEYEEGKYPEATHVIFDESEEVEKLAKKVEIEERAVKEVADLSVRQKRDIILILSEKSAKGKSDSYVTVKMSELVKSNPKSVLRLIDTESEEVAVHALIVECLQNSILTKKGHKISYHDSVLGSDIEDVIEYLLKDENQTLKLRLTEQVNS